MSVLITKADGSTELFDVGKLRSSLQRSGATKENVEQVAALIEAEVYPGITTSEIYRRAFAHLRDHKGAVAARYSLKRAILEFGPSGFPFEAYIAEIFRAEGHEAVIDQIEQGACVDHEVDVVSQTKDGATIYVEAKFHNSAGFKTDLKTVLYVEARMDDIRALRPKERIEGLVVTNTSFTEKAIQYATCKGLNLLGWDYPANHSLHERIDAAKIYPITALATLSKREKMALLNEKAVTCNTLPHHTEVLARVGVGGKRVESVLEEVGALCIPGKDI